MALVTNPESSKGILQTIKGALSLFGDTNKTESVLDTAPMVYQDPYESSLGEGEILMLTDTWKRTYASYYTHIDESQKLSYNYWLGKQRGDDTTPGSTLNGASTLVDNKIFEAVETFLPIATRANPDPIVQADPGVRGQAVSRSTKSALTYQADKTKLRRKLARALRHWAIYQLGALKVSWDASTRTIRTDVINPRRFIFDKDGYIDEGGNFVGEYIGEKKRITAEVLATLFPNKRQEITAYAEGSMATKLEYIEWWYKGRDVFYTLGEGIVLGKFKNPDWNYDVPEEPAKEAVLDENGTIVEEATEGTSAVEGKNHLEQPQYPYVFVSVFSLGLHPHDETSLILQNITLQDLINRRLRQIDKNVEGMNNGMVVSNVFTESQAAEAASSLRKGIAIRVPSNDVTNAVKRFPPQGLPTDVYKNYEDTKGELSAIFGTAGSTPQALNKQDTVRGKILVSQSDSSRIGGGITEQLEQVADTIYNKWVQMMFVYWDEEEYVLAAGNTGGMELFTIKNTDFQALRSLVVTVKEGSLIPKDPLTQRNEAIDLWSANAIDPLTFYKRLDFPDPVQQTNQLMLWQMFQKGLVPPNAYLPSFQVQAQSGALPQEQPGTGGVAVSPPENSPMPQGQTVPPGSPEAVDAQERQLIQSVPIQ